MLRYVLSFPGLKTSWVIHFSPRQHLTDLSSGFCLSDFSSSSSFSSSFSPSDSQDVVQGRALSRLHLAKGPEAHKDAQTDPITSDDILEAAKAVEMTDLEAGQEADTLAQDQQDSKKRDSSQADGGKHVHMADAPPFGANQYSGMRSNEAEKKAKLWDNMLKRKVGAEIGKQKKDGIASSLQDEEVQAPRVESQGALLDPITHSSDRVSETLPPSHLQPRQLPPLDQPKYLSKQGLKGALNISRRLLRKTDGGGGKAAASGGPGPPGSGRLVHGLETAGSMDSNAPLLPAGILSGHYHIFLGSGFQSLGFQVWYDASPASLHMAHWPLFLSAA